MSALPWGARPLAGRLRRTPKDGGHRCSLPTPAADEIADIAELTTTTEGASALADTLARLVAEGHATGRYALYLYSLTHDEARWVASWMRALSAPGG